MPDYHSFSAYVCKDTTFLNLSRWKIKLWIALKFFVLLQSKQPGMAAQTPLTCCELLSNFLYFCSRNNFCNNFIITRSVVNCSQIFCTFAVETTARPNVLTKDALWIALKFFVLLQSKQPSVLTKVSSIGCELLSNFLYFCSRNNIPIYSPLI